MNKEGHEFWQSIRSFSALHTDLLLKKLKNQLILHLINSLFSPYSAAQV